MSNPGFGGINPMMNNGIGMSMNPAGMNMNPMGMSNNGMVMNNNGMDMNMNPMGMNNNFMNNGMGMNNMNIGMNPSFNPMMMNNAQNFQNMQNMANMMMNNFQNFQNMQQNFGNNQNIQTQAEPQANQGNINLYFRISETQTIKSDDNIILIQCNINDKVADIVEKYRNKSLDREEKNFVFNAKKLNLSLTAAEAGLNNGCTMFVLNPKNVKGAL